MLGPNSQTRQTRWFDKLLGFLSFQNVNVIRDIHVRFGEANLKLL